MAAAKSYVYFQSQVTIEFHAIIFNFVIQDFCISATSSKHRKLCSRKHKAAHGSAINILQNGNIIATMPAGFRKFEHCMSFDEVDLKNDNFQFISTGIG